MFENSSKTIMLLPKILFVITCIYDAILVICGFIIDAIIGIILLILSPLLILIAYVTFSFIYAFGEIAENSSISAKNSSKIFKKLNTASNIDKAKDQQDVEPSCPRASDPDPSTLSVINLRKQFEAGEISEETYNAQVRKIMSEL